MVVSLELNRLAFYVLATAVAAYPIFVAVDAYAIARRVDGAASSGIRGGGPTSVCSSSFTC